MITHKHKQSSHNIGFGWAVENLIRLVMGIAGLWYRRAMRLPLMVRN